MWGQTSWRPGIGSFPGPQLCLAENSKKKVPRVENNRVLLFIYFFSMRQKAALFLHIFRWFQVSFSSRQEMFTLRFKILTGVLSLRGHSCDLSRISTFHQTDTHMEIIISWRQNQNKLDLTFVRTDHLPSKAATVPVFIKLKKSMVAKSICGRYLPCFTVKNNVTKRCSHDC